MGPCWNKACLLHTAQYSFRWIFFGSVVQPSSCKLPGWLHPFYSCCSEYYVLVKRHTRDRSSPRYEAVRNLLTTEKEVLAIDCFGVSYVHLWWLPIHLTLARIPTQLFRKTTRKLETASVFDPLILLILILKCNFGLRGSPLQTLLHNSDPY